MSDLYFRRPGGTMLKIGADALATLRHYEQHASSDFEAGGVLLGRRFAAGIVVDSATAPMAGDVRSRFGFHRSAAAHQRAIDAAWEQSGGTIGYLGEWHTHPEPRPTPSDTDLDDWRKRLACDVVDSETTLFIIVGQREIAVWEGDRRTGAISRLVERRAEAA